MDLAFKGCNYSLDWTTGLDYWIHLSSQLLDLASYNCTNAIDDLLPCALHNNNNYYYYDIVSMENFHNHNTMRIIIQYYCSLFTKRKCLVEMNSKM